MQEYFLVDEKYFPEAEGYDTVEMDMTYEDKMKIEAEIDKLDGDFYRDPKRLDHTIPEKNYTTLPVSISLYLSRTNIMTMRMDSGMSILRRRGRGTPRPL